MGWAQRRNSVWLESDMKITGGVKAYSGEPRFLLCADTWMAVWETELETWENTQFLVFFKSAQCLLDIAVYIICRLFMCKAGAVLKCVLIGV